MTEKSHGYAWELSVAVGLRSKIEHYLGWDPVAQALVVEAGSVQECLSMPTELAEAFLLKCLEKDFSDRFLVDWTRAEQEYIEVGGVSLFIYRGKVAPKLTDRMPKLLLRVQDGKRSASISLAPELRTALSRAVKLLTPEDIHSYLYPQAAAA